MTDVRRIRVGRGGPLPARPVVTGLGRAGGAHLRHAVCRGAGVRCFVALGALALGLAIGAGCGRRPAGTSSAVAPVSAPQRIVSLAPSLTEMLFDLGLGPRVVGVTSFCDYPPEAAERATVGGLLDPNLEAILALGPDLVVLFEHHAAALTGLQALGLPCLTVQGDTVDQVLVALGSIADRCGCHERGTTRVRELRERIAAVAAGPRPDPPPRVLVSIGRTLGGGTLQDVYVAGEDGFFSELIRLSGGTNACPEKTIRFPLVSPEGIMEMRPDVIIELAADLERLGIAPDQVAREWQAVREAPAVAHGQVHVFTEDYVTVPGPRFVLLLEKMAAVIRQARPTTTPRPEGSP